MQTVENNEMHIISSHTSIVQKYEIKLIVNS